MKKVLMSFIVASVMLLTFPSESFSMPAFSRKYKTSCATCHVAFPKLTAFGEAFRRNGYQFPDGGDAAATKEDPVSIGAEGNKRAFPDAIWPSTIPGSSPIGIVAELEATFGNDRAQKWDFSTLEGEAEILAAGTIGEDISFYSEVEIADDAIEIGRAYLIFSNLFGGSTAMFNLKVGKFEPGVFSFSNHRRISAKYGITMNTFGDNSWSLEGEQKGIETNGVIGEGRLGYNVGLVEGKGNEPNGQKDFYGHMTYKFGGMRLDGVVPEGAAPPEGATPPEGASHPWQDNSVTIGGFAYRGNAALASGAEDQFTMLGGDVNIWYERLNLIAAMAQQRDDNPLSMAPAVSSNQTSFMVEGSYILYPWLIPLARYENVKIKDALVSDTRIVSAIQFLIRANVRCALEGNFISKPKASDPAQTEIAFDEFALGLSVGF